MTVARRESGQAVVMVVLLLAVLLGMAAAVLDVGSWFRADRRLQATVDAATLAGAHALPESTGDAMALALEYAEKNGGGLEAGDVSFSTTVLPNDTITVEAEEPAPGFFSKVFGIETVQVHARARARTGTVTEAKWVAPIVVDLLHPMLKCKPTPCFGTETELNLVNLHKPGSGDAAGAFGLINLRLGDKGSVGAEELSGWMTRGFDQNMPLGVYNSVPSAMFNSTHFRSAMDLRLGDEVLFPIYKTLKKGGSTAEYDIVGWVGFNIHSYSGGGDSGKLKGHFTRVIWEGVISESPTDITTDFGVRAIALIE
jgi:hypothetical protein